MSSGGLWTEISGLCLLEGVWNTHARKAVFVGFLRQSFTAKEIIVWIKTLEYSTVRCLFKLVIRDTRLRHGLLSFRDRMDKQACC